MLTLILKFSIVANVNKLLKRSLHHPQFLQDYVSWSSLYHSNLSKQGYNSSCAFCMCTFYYRRYLYIYISLWRWNDQVQVENSSWGVADYCLCRSIQSLRVLSCSSSPSKFALDSRPLMSDTALLKRLEVGFVQQLC